MHHSTLPADPVELPSLMLAAHRGDQVAWCRLYDSTQAWMHAYLRGRIPAHLRARFDANDVMQEALLSLSRSPAVLASGDETLLRRFLAEVLQNGLCDEVRRHQRQRRSARLESSSDSDWATIEARDELPCECAERRDLSAFVRKGLSRLPRTEQVLLWQRFVNGMTWVEISRQSGVSEPTVRRRGVEALEHLALGRLA